ncbi:monovalent cation/H+ antiporter complex subunit F [Persicirhabdus sediminis]|uniref:Multicomponent Na+:H+ antiporter subunit F n=1 Tax=Persicirhabdus sediminis TaxID=454144 RepID=A0A8J7MBW6_9BACT|nr:monovalent cation/H+ antiporter complex subunit F [Persicirhabdus sediminis]MBK1789605.1 hypothetical protein [Persicirhabdus sediminis]
MSCLFVCLLKGKNMANAVIVLDVATILALGIFSGLAIIDNEPRYVDVGLVLALVGFLTTVALSRLVKTKKQAETDKLNQEIL